MFRRSSDTIRSGRLVFTSSTPVATKPDFFVTIVDCPSRLPEFLADWQELAAHAVEPNPFYEPWMLMPALEAFGRDLDLLFVFVYRRKAIRPNGPPVLIGFSPLLGKRRYKGIPLRVLKLYEYVHCFLDTPLVRNGFGKECLDTFFEWAGNDPNGAPIIEMGQVAGEGPFQHLLIDHCLTHHRLTFVDERHTRAFFRPASNAEQYLAQAFSTKLRKELRRQKKRLGEQGRLELRELTTEDELDEWLQQFRELEHRGWKGKQGTSFQATDVDRKFFDTVGRKAFRLGRLMMLGLFLDGQPIAIKLNFVTAPGSFAFKIAYDESLSKFSPGVLLEVENIRRLHEMADLDWMDSCAVAEHPMINRLWKDRRAIQTILVSTDLAGGDFVVSALPLIRWLKRRWPFGDIT